MNVYTAGLADMGWTIANNTITSMNPQGFQDFLPTVWPSDVVGYPTYQDAMKGWDGPSLNWTTRNGVTGTALGERSTQLLLADRRFATFAMTVAITFGGQGTDQAGILLAPAGTKGPVYRIALSADGRLSVDRGTKTIDAKAVSAVIAPGRWAELKIWTNGSQLEVFVNGVMQCGLVHRLTPKESVGLSVEQGEATFQDFSVVKAYPSPLLFSDEFATSRGWSSPLGT
jgi:hypothetical protein